MKNKFTFTIAFLLFICISVKLNAQTSKIQIVHNSPDYIIDTVDVWCDTVKIANDLVFRKATTLITVDSGDHVITISKKFSTDTTSLYSLLRVEGFRIDTSKNYLAFITGVQDTMDYAANPNGIDRSLSFVAIDSYKTTGTALQVDLSFFNGAPDAGQLDLNEIGLPGLVKLGDDVAYNAFSANTLLTGVNTIFNITSADSSAIWAAYKLNMAAAGFKGATVCIFASGVVDKTSSPADAAPVNFYVVLNNGTVTPLTKLVSDIQLVHTSPDVNNDSVDIYIDGALAYDNFAYKGATPFTSVNAFVSHSIAVAPKTSATAGDAFYSTSMSFDTVNYYVIAHGVNNASQYKANPDGKNIDFKISTYKGARKTSTVSKNVDLLYFHSGTDLQATTCRGEDQSQFLSKNDSYGAFHGYGAHTSLDNIVMLLRDAATDSVLYTGVANLSIGQGKGGLVYLSGFLDESAANQNGDSLVMYVVWPDGNVDSIAVIKNPVGIAENVLGNVKVSVFPNPAVDQFTIHMDAQTKTNLSVLVTDITGKVVYSETTTITAGANNVLMNTTGYGAGMYFVTLSSNGESLTQKVSIIK